MAATPLPPFAQGAGTTILQGGGFGGQHGMHTINIDQAGAVPMEKYALSPRIYTKNGDYFPLTVVLQAPPMKDIVDADDVYRWRTDEPLPQRDTIDGSLLVGAVTFLVANVNKFTERDEIMIRGYGAQGVLTGVNYATGAVTVQWTHAPAVNIPSGTPITRINTAYEQASQHNPRPTLQTVQAHNVYQDSRHPVSASDQMIAGNYYHGDEFARQIAKQRYDHMVEKEKTVIYGRQALVQTGNSPCGFTNGFYWFGQTGGNVTSMGGVPLTLPVWNAFWSSLFRRNTKSMTKDWWFVCSGMIHEQISNFFAWTERSTTEKHQAGMWVSTYQHPAGPKITLKTHELFNLEAWDDLGIAINLDPEALALVHHACNPGTRRIDAIIPYAGTWQEVLYRDVFTVKCAAPDINIGILEDVA